RPIAPPSLCAIGLNLDSTGITAMINSGSTPITLPSRYAVPTSSRVASWEMRYLLAIALATASISGSADAAGRCQCPWPTSLRGEPGMVAGGCAGPPATIPPSRADDAETTATSTTTSMAKTPAGAPPDRADRLRIAVLRAAQGNLFGIENLRVLVPTDDRDASRSPPSGRPAGVTLLQSGPPCPRRRSFAGAPKAGTFPHIGPHAARAGRARA